MTDLHAKYGPTVRISPHEVAFCGLEDVRSIHGVNSGFVKSDWYQMLDTDPYLGAFSEVDPKKHTERRRLLGFGFSNSNIKKWENHVRGEIDVALTKMEQEANKEGRVDILKWWTFLATDVISELCFGSSFEMLKQGKKNQYMIDVESSLMLASLVAEFPRLVPLLSYLPIPYVRWMENAVANKTNYGHQSIQRRKRMALSGELKTDRPGIFDKMFAAGEKQVMPDAAMGAEAGNLIVGGSDTTGVTLTYLVWATLKCPEAHARVLEEVRGLEEPLTTEKVSQLPYFEAVIKETVRLYGALPGMLPRTVPAGGRTLGGHFIPEKLTATTHAYCLHRDPKIFPSPERFWPERWLAPHWNQTMEDASQAFSMGSRKCLGIHLAMMELQVGSATFFKRFPNARVLDDFSDEEMEMENFFLVAPKGHKCLVKLAS